MKRRLCRLLVAAYPPLHRKEFGSEMLWILDQPGEATLRCLLDLTMSLLRQRMGRTEIWRWPVIAVFAVMPFYIGLWLLNFMLRWTKFISVSHEAILFFSSVFVVATTAGLSFFNASLLERRARFRRSRSTGGSRRERPTLP